MEYLRAVFSAPEAKVEIKGPDAKTENGAPAFSTSSDARVDLFSTARGVTEAKFVETVKAAWMESPIDTIRIIFYLRDCRAGCGEKEIFRWGFQTISKINQNAVLINIEHIPHYGYWKDLLYFFSTPEWNHFASKFAIQLVKDVDSLKTGEKSISLAGKWAPSQNSSFDKKSNACKKICTHLPGNPNMAEYRKNYIAPLRAHLDVVERKICSNLWSEIDYSKVPSVAMHNLAAAFRKHDRQRFDKFLRDVRAGKTKINTDQIYPHQLIEKYKSNAICLPVVEDELIEAQWRSLVDGIKKKGLLKHAIPICDVSGSMAGTPIHVSIALGLIIAEVTEEPFHDHVIIFSANVRFLKIDSSLSLLEKIKRISTEDFNSTNYFNVHQTIVMKMIESKVSIENCPQQIFIFSDMQFDQICGCEKNDLVSMHESVKKLYADAGYPIPKTIYWNLNGKYDNKPVRSNEQGVALIGGFSPKLIQFFLEDASKTPYEMMRSVVDSERYARISV
jgi:Domain of unknown function (DUF2828)